MDFNLETMAFSKWKGKNKLDTSANSLWYALLEVQARAGWKRKFNAPNPILQQLSGLSKQGVINARNVLKKNNLIAFEKRTKGRAAVYQFISLVKPVDSPVQSVDHLQSTHLTIHRHRHRQDEREMDVQSIIQFYEAHIGMLSIFGREELLNWREKVSDELILAAIEHAADYDARTVRYVVKILQEWAENGIETVQEVLAYRKAKWKTKTVPYQKSKPFDYQSLFDELRREG